MLAVYQNHLNDIDAVFFGKSKITLVVGRNTHDSTIAIAHQHVIAYPDFDLVAVGRMRHVQARGHTFLFAGCDFSFGGTARLERFNARGQVRRQLRRAHGQRVLGRNRYKGHTLDGVRPGGENIHAPVLDQFALGIANFMRKRESHAF